MPHCVIEYSENLATACPPARLVEAVQRGALESGLFEPDHVRTRAIAYTECISGHQARHFVHVTLKILSGREQGQKKALSERVLGELERLGLSSISLTVEVSDMDRETYSKTII
jgi:5-carboxymethyl-2-hydroxymuconate isomerase